MNTFKKRSLCLLIAMLLMLPTLTGCSLSTGIDTLMSPPTLTEEQEDIYQALISSVGSNIKLRYPKSGSWLSAFVIYNLDDEPTDEAIVFYERTGITSNETTLRINILDMIDGRWQSVYDHSGTGTDIERVMLSTLGESDEVSIIVGFSLVAQSDKIINLYNYSDGILKLAYTASYSTAQIIDLTETGQNQLLLVSSATSAHAPEARTVALDSSGVCVISTAAMSNTATEYTQVVCGKLSDGSKGIYVDSLTAAGTARTELLYLYEGALLNAFYSPDNEKNPLLDRTERPVGALCTDIDGDGTIEIPSASRLPGYEQLPDTEALYATSWLGYEDKALYTKLRSYYSTFSDFCFIFPKKWQDITAESSATGEIIFSEVKSKAKLLTIASVPKSDIAAKEREGFTLIYSKSETAYLAKLPTGGSELIPTITATALNMKIL